MTGHLALVRAGPPVVTGSPRRAPPGWVPGSSAPVPGLPRLPKPLPANQPSHRVRSAPPPGSPAYRATDDRPMARSRPPTRNAEPPGPPPRHGGIGSPTRRSLHGEWCAAPPPTLPLGSANDPWPALPSARRERPPTRPPFARRERPSARPSASGRRERPPPRPVVSALEPSCGWVGMGGRIRALIGRPGVGRPTWATAGGGTWAFLGGVGRDWAPPVGGRGGPAGVMVAPGGRAARCPRGGSP